MIRVTPTKPGNVCSTIGKRDKYALTCSDENRAHSDLNANRNFVYLSGTVVSCSGTVSHIYVAVHIENNTKPLTLAGGCLL